jgi:glutamate-ammonia-ligase adenylyltransferase
MQSTAARHEDPVEATTAIRAIRRRELFRLATGELFGFIGIDELGEGLTAVTAATIESALDVAMRSVAAERRGELPMRMAVISMGRFGGGELSYSSDADVMFVFEPLQGADSSDATRAAQDVAQELRRLLMLPGTDPGLDIDADLRPEGRKGALVRSLDSYAAYYARWSAVWEAQALLRADAVIGHPDLCAAFIELIDPLRFPEGGVTPDDVREIRRIKARVDTERLPRGADPATHLKLGRGGLADIEWTVQLLQMRYAWKHVSLRTPRTLEALRGAVSEGLMTAEDADVLTRAWRSASRIRNAIVQVRGKSADSLPRDAREKAAVAHVLGYGPGSSDEMVNDHLRLTRHASAAVDRLFWEG